MGANMRAPKLQGSLYSKVDKMVPAASHVASVPSIPPGPPAASRLLPAAALCCAEPPPPPLLAVELPGAATPAIPASQASTRCGCPLTSAHSAPSRSATAGVAAEYLQVGPGVCALAGKLAMGRRCCQPVCRAMVWRGAWLPSRAGSHRGWPAAAASSTAHHSSSHSDGR